MRITEIAETVRSVASSSTEEALRAVISLAMRTGDWTTGSITSVGSAGSLQTVVYVGILAPECDRLQSASGGGPAYDAALGGSYQFAGDLREDDRWELWPSRVCDVGVVSALSLRLHTIGTAGTLNLYGRQPQKIGGDALERAELIAAHASVLMAHYNAEQQFLQAIHTGTVVGQAQGILMERYQLSPAMALALLRNMSEQGGGEIPELAEHLVATGKFT